MSNIIRLVPPATDIVQVYQKQIETFRDDHLAHRYAVWIQKLSRRSHGEPGSEQEFNRVRAFLYELDEFAVEIATYWQYLDHIEGRPSVTTRLDTSPRPLPVWCEASSGERVEDSLGNYYIQLEHSRLAQLSYWHAIRRETEYHTGIIRSATLDEAKAWTALDAIDRGATKGHTPEVRAQWDVIHAGYSSLNAQYAE